jgi:diguanylate cyclase (GGDEF)-like protein/PAS domain S-box-containing protein
MSDGATNAWLPGTRKDGDESYDELLRRADFFEALASRSGDYTQVVDGQFELIYATPKMSADLGYSLAEMQEIIRDGMNNIHPDDRAHVTGLFLRVTSTPHATETLVFRIAAANGEWRWLEEHLTNLLDDPDIAGIIVTGRDVTERRLAQEALSASEARFRAIAETAQEGIWTFDREGKTTFANPRVAEILGLPLDVVYQSEATAVLDPEGRVSRIRDVQEADRWLRTSDLTYSHPDGTDRILTARISKFRDDAGRKGYLTMVSDVTSARQAERELLRLALYDDLTGLPNRALLRDRLVHAVTTAQRRTAGATAVLIADLDQFKMINDAWGHEAGDALLKQVAQRTIDAVRTADTVARFGGDEFVVVAEDVTEEGARALADRIHEALNEPFDLAGRRAHITSSIGIALCPPHEVDNLLRFADVAMYRAKASGRGATDVFDLLAAEQTADVLSLSNDLRLALSSGGLTLLYQPIFDLRDESIAGVEALVRWHHPDRGVLRPGQFVEIGERMGLAPLLDDWVLNRACTDLPTIQAALGTHAYVSVNTSANHVSQPDFQTSVERALRGNDVDSHIDRQIDPGIAPYIVLEVTETALMHEPERAREVLHRLRDRGIRVALDDFGTGYSSLGYLSRLPIDILKIDRSFIEALTRDPEAHAIAAAITDLARSLGLGTVAEGIETGEQADAVTALGCTHGQGYLWSPAVPVEDLRSL